MEQFTNALLALSRLHSQITNSPESEDFKKHIKTWGAGIFRIVVMGEIKKGKSSFINALLGVRELVPTSSDVATSTIYKIHYGKENGYKVHFLPETKRKFISINSSEIAQYGTEAGNPCNKKKVDFIEVISDAELLKGGIVIIDTPGLGGLFREHKKITWQHVPKADAVFFITDSVESPIGEEELDHLKTVRKITPHLFFIQTKASNVSKEAAEARRKNNLDILSLNFQIDAKKIPYFITDAHLKQDALTDSDMELLNISGYPALMRFIQNSLIKQQQQLIKAKAICYATPILKTIQLNLKNRKEVILADTEEKQRKAKEDIKAAQNALIEWQQDGKEKLQNEIIRGFNHLKTQCEDFCHQLKPYGEIHSALEERINNVSEMEQLRELVSDIEEKLPDAAAECMSEIQRKYEYGLHQLFEILSSSEKSFDSAVVIRDDTSTAIVQRPSFNPVINFPLNEDSTWKQLRNGIVGFSLGSSIGAFIGGTVGSIIPVLGTAVGTQVGAFIGGLFGGVAADIDREEDELKSVKNQAVNALGKNINSVYSNLMASLRKINDQCSNMVMDSMRDSLRQRTDELSNTYKQLVERSKLNAKELAEAKKTLSRDTTLLNNILKLLKAS